MRITEEAIQIATEKLGISRNSFYISNKGYPFSKFSSIYTFNTESLSQYIPFLQLEGKDVLVPFGSADHIIAAASENCNSVDGFDINYNEYLYGSLKLAALKELTEEEFSLYFIHTLVETKNKDGKKCYIYKDNPYIMNQKIYNKFKHQLEKDVRYFWDTLYECSDGYSIAHSNLFDKDNICQDQIILNNWYLQKGNYQKTQEQIKKIQSPVFFQSNVTSLYNKTDKKYDVILLSNISQYAGNLFSENVLSRFKNMVTQDLDQMLKPNGQIVFAYLYGKNNILVKDSFSNPIEYQKTFFEPCFTSFTFPSNWVKGTDTIKVYTKKSL